MGRPRSYMSGRIENYKLAVFGSGAVGKTSLIKCFVTGEFCTPNYAPTVEDVYRYFLRISTRIFNLTIVDSSGTYDFPAMKELSIRESSAFILVFATNDRQSFEHFQKDMCAVLQKRPDAKILIVGNKIDISDRTVSAVEVISHAAEQRRKYPLCQYKYLETSAKNQHNVREVFNEAVRLLKPSLKQKGKEKKTKKIRGLARPCTIL